MKQLIKLLIVSAGVVFALNFLLTLSDSNEAGSYIPAAKAACDLADFNRLETEFQTMVQLRKYDPAAVSDETYKATALAYIENAEFCYETTVAPGAQAQTEPVLIDDGGAWFPGFEPDEDELSGQYVVQGNKWGISGLGNPGGTVTYSYIPQGVSHAVEDKGANTHISNLNGFSDCFYTDIETAFAAWSAVADINFVQVVDNGVSSNAFGAVGDIRIGAHPFDGSSGILAHAYFPPPNGTSIAGDLHFDSAENWRCTPSGGFDIGFVALHEIGHSLGLGHEPMPGNGGNPAVMNPYYNPGITSLLADDVNGIRLIYGAREMGSSLTNDPFPITDSTNSVTFTIVLHNNGSTPLTNVLISNTIPAGTTYAAGSASDGGSETFSGSKIITWPPTTLPGNASIGRTFRVNITEPIAAGDILVNKLSVTSDQGVEIDNKSYFSFVNPKLIYLPLMAR